MKIKILLLLLTLTICFKKNAISQIDSITISGRIDTTLMKEYATNELVIKSRYTANFYSRSEQITTIITREGFFKIRFKPENQFVYLSFELLYKGNDSGKLGLYANISQYSRPWLQEQNEMYLFENGDIINFTLGTKGNILFKGKGSEKLNCQFQMYMIEPLSAGFVYRAVDYNNNGEMLKKLILQDSLIDLGIKQRITILNSYKKQLDIITYKLLYLDAIGSATYIPLSNITGNCYLFPEEVNHLQKYYNIYLKKNQLPLIDSNYIAESAYYADMLFEKEFNYFRLNSKNKFYSKGDSFKEIYNQLKLHYSGKLRDKLLYICFEKLNKYYSNESLPFVEDALKIMKNEIYITLLKKFAEKEDHLYPFELPDDKGYQHKLSDFRGKVLIIDFWFTGCSACAILNTFMTPIISKFKNNRNVQFISICVDQNKNMWLNSLNTGKYTTKNELNLYTNSLGQQHPMIQFHNLIGFPRQLIIGKKGEIITSTPPNVSSTPSGSMINSQTTAEDVAYNTNVFTKIIEDYLKNN